MLIPDYSKISESIRKEFEEAQNNPEYRTDVRVFAREQLSKGLGIRLNNNMSTGKVWPPYLTYDGMWGSTRKEYHFSYIFRQCTLSDVDWISNDDCVKAIVDMATDPSLPDSNRNYWAARYEVDFRAQPGLSLVDPKILERLNNGHQLAVFVEFTRDSDLNRIEKDEILWRYCELRMDYHRTWKGNSVGGMYARFITPRILNFIVSLCGDKSHGQGSIAGIYDLVEGFAPEHRPWDQRWPQWPPQA